MTLRSCSCSGKPQLALHSFTVKDCCVREKRPPKQKHGWLPFALQIAGITHPPHLLWVGKIIFQTFRSKNQRCHAYLGKIQYVTQVKYWQIPTTEKKVWCVSVSTVNFLRLLSWLVRFANGERHCFPGTCVSSQSSWNHETGEQQFWTCSTASRIHWSEANTFILIVPISWGTPGRFKINSSISILPSLYNSNMLLWLSNRLRILNAT